MKKIFCLSFALLFCLNLFGDAKGDEIAKKNHSLKKSNDMSSETVMVIIDKNGNQKIRKLTMYSKETPSGRNSFTEFQEPADVKGTRFLTLGNKKGDDEQRLYLPALKKTRLISSSSKNGKFMGSDLSYYDMEERQYSDSTYKFIRDEKFQDKDCSVIEMTPVDESSPYSHSLAWINKADSFTYKIELYDKKDNTLLKTIIFVEVKTVDGILLPVRMVVENKKEGTKTLLQMNNLAVNKGISDRIFSVQNLEN